MVGVRVRQKCIALSRYETMSSSTSPVLKPCHSERWGYVFRTGLVGRFLHGFMFSNLDIFIEKPFSILSSSCLPCLHNQRKDHNGPSGQQADPTCEIRARAREERELAN